MKRILLILGLFISISTINAQNFGFEADVREGCYPLSVTFTNTSDTREGYTFEWHMDNVVFDNNEEIVEKVFSNSGAGVTIPVTMRIYNSEDRSLVAEVIEPNYITIFPEPYVRIQTDRTVVCSGGSVTFTPEYVDTAAAVVSWGWYSDNIRSGTNEVFTNSFYSSGDVNIYLVVRDANGCTNSLTKAQESIDIDVVDNNIPFPEITHTPGGNNGLYCTDEVTVSFSYSNYDADMINNFYWDFGDGATNENQSTVTRTFSGIGFYQVILTAEDANCALGSYPTYIELDQYSPILDIYDTHTQQSVSDGGTVCPGEIQLATGSSRDGYEWRINGAFYSNSQECTYQTFGGEDLTIAITATGSNGCEGTTIKTIHVEEPLQADFSYSEDHICEPQDIEVTGTTNIPGTDFIYILNGNEFQTEQSFTFTPQENIYELILNATSPNGCRAAAVSHLFEASYPHAQFDFTEASVTCAPYTQEFTQSSYYRPTHFNDEIVSWEWNFGDASPTETTTGPNEIANHTYQDGTFTPTLTVISQLGCRSTTVVRETMPEHLDVGTIPVLRYQVDTHLLCASSTLIIIDSSINTSTTSDAISVSAIYTSGINTEAAGAVEHISSLVDTIKVNEWDTLGRWTALLRANDRECFATEALVQDSVHILGPYTKIRTLHNCDSAYNNVYAEIVKLYDVDSVRWDWKATINDTEIIHRDSPSDTAHQFMLDTTIAGVGDYEFSLTVFNENIEECVSYTNKSYAPVRKIAINYNVIRDKRCWTDSLYYPSINENMNTTDGDPALAYDDFAYTWRSIAPDGSVTTGDFNTQSNINNPPQPPRDTIDVLDTVIMNQEGFYTIYAISEDRTWHCPDSVTQEIQVVHPHPNFTTSPLNGCSPLEVIFYDSTEYEINPERRLWTTNGQHIDSYLYNGIDTTFDIYTPIDITQNPVSINLQVEVEIPNSNYTCTNDTTINLTIEPIEPGLNIECTTLHVCEGYEATFVNHSTNVDDIVWDFGDGSTSISDTTDTIRHLYTTAQADPYMVRITSTQASDYGICEKRDSFEIDVKILEAALDVRSVPEDNCYNTMGIGNDWVIYPANLYEEYDFQFLFYNDGEFQNFEYGSYRYPSDTLLGWHYANMAMVTDFVGCDTIWSDTLDMFVKGVIVDYAIAPRPVCINDTVTVRFTEFSKNMNEVDFTWDMQDGTTYSNSFVVEHAYDFVPLDPYFLINLSIDHDATCNSQSVYTDTVFLYEIMADFTMNDTTINAVGCETFEVAIQNTSRGSQGNTWHLNDELIELEDTDTLYLDNGDYELRLDIDNNQCLDDQIRHIKIYPSPHLNAIVDTLNCQDDTVYVDAQPDSEGYMYVWEPAHLFVDATVSDPKIISVQQSDSLFVWATNRFDCKDSARMFMNVQLRPTYNGAPVNPYKFWFDDSLHTYRSADTILVNDRFNFNNDSIQGVAYKWEPAQWLSCTNCASPNIFIDRFIEDSEQPLSYTITMTNECFHEEAYVDIIVLNEMLVDLPTGFTPNADKSNDILFVRGWGIKELVELKIYNRWGQEVFYSSDLKEGWDGTFKGSDQPMGTFTYILKVKDFKDELVTKQGHFDLLR